MDLKERRNLLLKDLSEQGCSTTEQRDILRGITGERLSMRQVQRINRKKGICRKPQEESPLEEIERAILTELEKPDGALLGYRAMWNLVKNAHDLVVKRKTVMILLALMDPENSAQRKSIYRRLKRRIYRSKGPNFLWHCDGYDKLKPFGLSIHGCIEGYSRKLLWLEIAESNNNPLHIAHYYLKCVERLGGCPQIVRTDLGTENSKIAFTQPLLRHNASDSFSGSNSHIYGRSTSNQRIEAFWSRLRRRYIEWWIDFFKMLQLEGNFNAAISYHVDAVRYSFGSMLQRELKQFMIEWNSHRIRPSKMAETPGGIPNVLFAFPELKGNENYLHAIEDEAIQALDAFHASSRLVSPEFVELANKLIQEHNLPYPTNFRNSLELYFSLIHLIDCYF